MREGLHSPDLTALESGTLWLALFCSFRDSVLPPPGKLQTSAHLNINLQLHHLSCDTTASCGDEAEPASSLALITGFSSAGTFQPSRVLPFAPSKTLRSANQIEMSPFILHTDN